MNRYAFIFAAIVATACTGAKDETTDDTDTDDSDADTDTDTDDSDTDTDA